MIQPYAKHTSVHGDDDHVISYGISSYGYDCRLANEFILFTGDRVIDPKQKLIEGEDYTRVTVSLESSVFTIYPGQFVLGRSVEYFSIPRDVVGLCLGKSTYARCGINLNATPLEPEWKGHITLEIFNSSNAPVQLYCGEGIAQILFLTGDEMCQVSYADRGGKYQGQTGVTLPKA